VVSPHVSPSVPREQARSSRVSTVSHVPSPQTSSVRTRVWMPPLSHTPSKPPQALQAVYSGGPPQLSPSVSRLHASDSLESAPPQVPAPQVYRVTVRERVPSSPQAPPKPPQPDHAPKSGSSQIRPAVSRTHDASSTCVSTVGSQTSATQAYVVTSRVRSPATSHRSS